MKDKDQKTETPIASPNFSGGLVVREFDRLSFLIKRDGLEGAKEFARRGVIAYRKTVLSKKGLIHRREFIESYLAFKRFAN